MCSANVSLSCVCRFGLDTSYEIPWVIAPAGTRVSLDREPATLQAPITCSPHHHVRRISVFRSRRVVDIDVSDGMFTDDAPSHCGQMLERVGCADSMAILAKRAVLRVYSLACVGESGDRFH